MTKSSSVHARMEENLKADVEGVLKQVGLSTSEAINLFFRQISLQRGIPFEVKIPNEATIAAMKDVVDGKTQTYSSIDELRSELDK